MMRRRRRIKEKSYRQGQIREGCFLRAGASLKARSGCGRRPPPHPSGLCAAMQRQARVSAENNAVYSVPQGRAELHIAADPGLPGWTLFGTFQSITDVQ